MLFHASILFYLATTALAWNDRPSVIVMIPDGFGPSQATLTREVSRVATNSSDLHGKLAFDDHVVGALQTKSANNLVTDSAAGGTAYSCGINTNNGIIAANANGTARATILEGAKRLGYNTGLVSTTRITHATPASFGAHALDRDNEGLIAEQLLGNYVLGRQVDLLFGGGRRQFLPQSDTASARKDDRNLIQEAKDAGYTYISNAVELKEYTSKSKSHLSRRTDAHLPALGLFTASHMSYEIDRNATLEPSLADMGIAALNALDNKPFFLMIEGGRIDHAGHANDAPTIYHDVRAYEEAYKQVIAWVQSRKNPEKYVVVSMADHDTGGAVLPGGWHPEVLLNATHSVEYLDAYATKSLVNVTDQAAVQWINHEILVSGLGLAANVTVAENLLDSVKNKTSIAAPLAKLKNQAAGLYWGTGGHSEVDVNIAVYPTKKELAGNHPNIYVAQWIENYLGLDLDAISAELTQVDLGPPVQGVAL